MPDYHVVYITTKTAEDAAQIGRTLVEERLAACVNIVNDMRSIYRWEGGVQEGNEAVIIAKTRRDRLPTLTERVKTLHSYDCPCIVAFALQDGEGNKDYLAWIGKQTEIS
jgi:periplasmic divalent cation tolerance protein